MIATFTTGQDADVSPPRLVDVSVTSRFVCNRDTSCSDSADHIMNTIAISAIEDDRPTAWVRIQYLEATGALITGPAPLVPTGHGCSGGSGPGWMRYLRMPEEFQIRAIDIAGNVELVAHPIIGGSCEALAEGTACDLTPGDDEPDDPEAPADGGGCSTGTPSGGAVVPVLFVILLVAGPRGHLRRTR